MKNRKVINAKRYFRTAKQGERQLGPLKLLPGEWVGEETGWNMIALPFHGASPPNGNNFRVLMNQYSEKLDFSFVDANVPNRGLLDAGTTGGAFDQKVATLDYQQHIKQVKAEDTPRSNLAGKPGLDIHHEPGLWLFMKNLTTEGLDIARLASVPHGNSVLAIGKSKVVKGMPSIPAISGLPIGRFEEMSVGSEEYDFKTDPYLAPYKKYIDNPFLGNRSNTDGFPGFNPLNMNAILHFANRNVNIKRTTVLTVDTTVKDGNVSSIPFVIKQAEPVSMRSTFWIQELAEKDPDGKPKLRLQYSQVVMLNFFSPREDQLPGRATWPHISICTLNKVYKNSSSSRKKK